MAVVVTAVFIPQQDKKDELVAALRATMPAVHAQDAGCLVYAIHDAEDGSITMIEKWESAELLQAHSQSAAMADLVAAVSDLVAEPIVVTSMTPIPVGTPEQGQL